MWYKYCLVSVVYVGLLEVGQAALAADLPNTPGQIVEKLVDRGRALSSGTLEVTRYEFTADRSEVDHLMRAFGASDQSPASRVAAVKDSRAVRPIRGSRIVLHYHNNKSHAIEDRLEGFGKEASDLAKAAEGAGAKAVLAAARMESLFDGERDFVAELYNGNKLFLTKAVTKVILPLVEIDHTLGPWHRFFQERPREHQVITAAVIDGKPKLIYTTDEGEGQQSSAEYTFDPDRGYAPTEVKGIRNKTVELCTLYVYVDEASSNQPQTPISTCTFRHLDGSVVQIQLWTVAKWTRQIKGDPQVMAVPPKCTVIDNRGKDKRVVLETGSSQRSFDLDGLLSLVGSQN